MSEQDVNGLLGGPEEPRPPSMLDAVTPVVALIGLIALSVYLFGLDSTNGALQVGLFTAMSIAGLIAHKNGHSYPALGNAVIGGISSAMGAIFILLAVGALIGTWNMAGTIPTIVDYGLRLLDPNWFYPLVVIICAIPWLFRWTKDQAIDRYLGELSYPLYICHVAVIWWVDSFVSLAGVPRGILIVGGALALSALLYAWVDRPVDRWRQMRLETRPVRLAPSPGSG